MRTLTVHTADDLIARWKGWAMDSQVAAEAMEGRPGYNRGYEHGKAQAYRVAAAELMAIVAVSMELEATHHGDPEPEEDKCPNCDDPGHPGHHWLAEPGCYVCFGRDTEPVSEPNRWPGFCRECGRDADHRWHTEQGPGFLGDGQVPHEYQP